MSKEPISKIGPIEEKESVTKVDKSEKSLSQSSADHFEALMNQGKGKEVAALDPSAQHSSILDEARNIGNRAPQRKSTEDLLAETERAIGNISAIKERLSTDGLNLDPTSQYKMRNNLTHIEDELRIALRQAGLDFDAAAGSAKASGMTAIERFFGMLSSAQGRLTNLGGALTEIHKGEKKISPAQMLMIQMKVNYVQQELEFFTNALNKSLESTKTLMNVQV